jgi:hypothetical protein
MPNPKPFCASHRSAGSDDVDAAGAARRALHEIRVVVGASAATRRAVAIVAGGLRDGSVASPMPTAAGALWLELGTYRRLDQVQLKTIHSSMEERDRLYRALQSESLALVAKWRAAAEDSNRWDDDGHLVAGAPADHLAAVDQLQAVLEAMPPAPAESRGQRRDPRRAQFSDLLLYLYGHGMQYGNPETYWKPVGDYSGSLAELLHSAPNDWTRAPLSEDDLAEHYGDAHRLYDFLRGQIRDARQRRRPKAP